jgi:hypothetical protein
VQQGQKAVGNEGSPQAFTYDTPVDGLILTQQINGKIAEEGKIFSAVILPITGLVFVKSYDQGAGQRIPTTQWLREQDNR